MSYLSQSPEVYKYNSQGGVVTSTEARVPLYPQNQMASFNVNRSLDDNMPYQAPSLNRFGESQI